jgi:uncharacterized ion transporter superfamily protein YfcC
VKNDSEKQNLETQLLLDGYKRKGTDLVLNKKFIWLFFLGFGSVLFIYIFVIFLILYIIYIIYYFKTREKDRVRIVSEGKPVPTDGVNVVNKGYTIPRTEIKKDPEREKRKNQFLIVLGIIIILILSVVYLSIFGGSYWYWYNTIVILFLLVIGIIPIIKGIYGLYVK